MPPRGRPNKGRKNNKKATEAAAAARHTRHGSGEGKAQDPPSYKPRGGDNSTRKGETPSSISSSDFKYIFFCFCKNSFVF